MGVLQQRFPPMIDYGSVDMEVDEELLSLSSFGTHTPDLLT